MTYDRAPRHQSGGTNRPARRSYLPQSSKFAAAAVAKPAAVTQQNKVHHADERVAMVNAAAAKRRKVVQHDVIAAPNKVAATKDKKQFGNLFTAKQQRTAVVEPSDISDDDDDEDAAAAEFESGESDVDEFAVNGGGGGQLEVDSDNDDDEPQKQSLLENSSSAGSSSASSDNDDDEVVDNRFDDVSSDDAAADEDDDNSDIELPIERANRRLELKNASILAASDAELKTSAAQAEQFVLPTDEELKAEQAAPLDNSALQARINNIISVLNDFRHLRVGNASRSHYMRQLVSDTSVYYGYLPELIEVFCDMFTPSEAVALMEANEQARPVTLRANTLKVKRRELAAALISRGVNLDPVGDWTKVGLKVYDSQVPLGATPEYLAGHYMLQSASSLLPVMALAPVPGEKVLDMCASPGGKTTHLGALMRNTGVLIANDINKARLPSLVYNVHRLGITNTVITNYDARKLPAHFNGFHRVLLDAPCTGLGVISRDPSIKLQKTRDDIKKCARLQKELVLAAVNMLNCANDSAATSKKSSSNGGGVSVENGGSVSVSSAGGYLVYSTCSISIEENEAVIEYLLSKRHVKLVDTGLTFGVEGFVNVRERRFHPSMRLCRRYYPHTHNMDGFFVAKLKKTGNGEKTTVDADADVKRERSQRLKVGGQQHDGEGEVEVNGVDGEFDMSSNDEDDNEMYGDTDDEEGSVDVSDDEAIVEVPTPTQPAQAKKSMKQARR